MKMGKAQLEKSEATSRYTSSNTKCNSVQTVEKANEHLGWLPDGWNVDFRTRKGGPRMGCGYKCYIDPNGNKFYSKPEVLRYLETINGSSCTSKMEERCNSMHSPNKDDVEKSAVEDLSSGCLTEVKNRKSSNHIGKDMGAFEKSTVKDIPPGWITEVTIRKVGKGNKKDVLYTDPVSGYGFHSKKDVLRYLESGDISTCKIKPSKRQIEDEDRLTPSSAGKKQKLEQSSIKVQLFVGKDISDEGILELPDANSSQKGQDVKVDSGMMVAPVPTSRSVVNTQSLQNSDDMQEKNHVVHMKEIASKKNQSNCNVSKSKEFNVGQRFSPRLAGVESDQLANSLTNELTLQVPKRNLRKSRVALNTDLANESSQQLNGVPKFDHSHEMQEEVVLNKGSMLSGCHALFKVQQCLLETDKIKYSEPEQNHYSLSRNSSLPSLKVAVKTIRTELPSPDSPPSSHGLDPEASLSKENRLYASQTRKSGLQEIQSNSNKSSNKKEHQIPRRASKRLAGSEPELMSDSFSHNKSLEYKSKRPKGEVNADLQQSEGQPTMVLADHSSIYGKPSNNSGKTSKVPPLINDQLGKLEDEEIDDEKSELQQSFTFHYSCYDPCVEFAIKTLTSLLPVEDLVGNFCTQIPETDIQQQPSLCQIPETDMLPKNKLFKNGRGSSSDKKLSALPVEDSISNRPTQIPETDMLPKSKLFENVKVSSNDRSPQVNSKKSKNKKEFNMQRRLAKRLAGNEPGMLPTERVLEYDSVENGPSQIPETVMLPKKKLFENVTGSSRDKNLMSALPVEGSVGNRSTQIPETDVLAKNKMFENVTGSSNDKSPHVSSKKSKNRKEINIHRRLSKRLAGNEPEVIPTERALEYATRKSCKDKPTATVILTNGECGHLHAEKESKLTVHASDMSETKVCGESSNKNDKSCARIAPNEQLQRLGAENIYDGKSEPQFPLPFGDSWSDSCLKFAIETLSGALPDDAAAADILPFMIPDINEPANKEFPESVVQKIKTVMIPDINDPPNEEILQKSIYEEAHDNSNQLQIKPVMILDINDSPNKEFPDSVLQKSINETADDNSNKPQIKTVMIPDINDPPNKELPQNVMQKSINQEAHDNFKEPQTKKELNVVSQPLEQPLDQPELRSSCTSCGNYPKFATGESSSDDVNITKKFDGGVSLCCKAEAGSVTGIDINTVILEEPLKDSEPVFQGEFVAGSQQPETINHGHSVGEYCLPFMDSWSDPCLEFPFKILTGVMPVDDDIPIQRCFQEFADPHDQRAGISLFPEFGSSSITQSDVSFHTDIGDKSIPGKQSSIKGRPSSHQ
ncbi:putative DNA-binding domain-containing protein [Lupinus albus]|uniref:Putative DNA-binding domain-containing protein n=1 Tax=Lupinus albus TaxID=3870 RepID=A0A6A4PYF8_LUPAL|nr:putative DNA-binding domain-containing protein [Lupinus albus]